MAREQFVRSEDYRSRYIAEHPGWHGQWYMCPYCGRFVKKDRMQVDHIISIDLANRQPLYRAKLGHGWYAAVWVLLILLIVGALTTILCGALTPQGVLAWLGMEITKLVLVMRRYVDSLLDVFLKSLREYHIL